jgi:hypothetical protein
MDMFNVLASQDSDEGSCHDPKDDKKIHNNVPEITGSVLKVCNVIREKNFGSKVLYKQTGVVCGARAGSGTVYEPVIMKT